MKKAYLSIVIVMAFGGVSYGTSAAVGRVAAAPVVQAPTRAALVEFLLGDTKGATNLDERRRQISQELDAQDLVLNKARRDGLINGKLDVQIELARRGVIFEASSVRLKSE